MAKVPKNQPEDNEDQPYTFSDERTKKKIRRHIGDIKDVITENDIKNVKVPGEEESEELQSPKTRKKDANLVVHDATGKPVTPWDILDEG